MEPLCYLLHLCLYKCYFDSNRSDYSSLTSSAWWLCLLRHQIINLLMTGLNPTTSKLFAKLCSFEWNCISWKLDRSMSSIRHSFRGSLFILYIPLILIKESLDVTIYVLYTYGMFHLISIFTPELEPNFLVYSVIFLISVGRAFSYSSYFVILFIKYISVFHDDRILEKIAPLKWLLFYLKFLFTIFIMILNNVLPPKVNGIFTLLTKKNEYHG